MQTKPSAGLAVAITKLFKLQRVWDSERTTVFIKCSSKTVILFVHWKKCMYCNSHLLRETSFTRCLFQTGCNSSQTTMFLCCVRGTSQWSGRQLYLCPSYYLNYLHFSLYRNTQIIFPPDNWYIPDTGRSNSASQATATSCQVASPVLTRMHLEPMTDSVTLASWTNCVFSDLINRNYSQHTSLCCLTYESRLVAAGFLSVSRRPSPRLKEASPVTY